MPVFKFLTCHGFYVLEGVIWAWILLSDHCNCNVIFLQVTACYIWHRMVWSGICQLLFKSRFITECLTYHGIYVLEGVFWAHILLTDCYNCNVIFLRVLLVTFGTGWCDLVNISCYSNLWFLQYVDMSWHLCVGGGVLSMNTHVRTLATNLWADKVSVDVWYSLACCLFHEVVFNGANLAIFVPDNYIDLHIDNPWHYLFVWVCCHSS